MGDSNGFEPWLGTKRFSTVSHLFTQPGSASKVAEGQVVLGGARVRGGAGERAVFFCQFRKINQSCVQVRRPVGRFRAPRKVEADRSFPHYSYQTNLNSQPDDQPLCGRGGNYLCAFTLFWHSECIPLQIVAQGAIRFSSRQDWDVFPPFN